MACAAANNGWASCLPLCRNASGRAANSLSERPAHPEKRGEARLYAPEPPPRLPRRASPRDSRRNGGGNRSRPSAAGIIPLAESGGKRCLGMRGRKNPSCNIASRPAGCLWTQMATGRSVRLPRCGKPISFGTHRKGRIARIVVYSLRQAGPGRQYGLRKTTLAPGFGLLPAVRRLQMQRRHG